MRRVAPLVVLAVLLSACGGPKADLELGLRGVSITAPRLITPALELVPAAPLPVSLPPIEPIALPPLPTRPAPAPACPTADAFAVPDQPASLLLSAPPAAGTFVQRSSGTFKGLVTTTVSRATRATASNGQRVESWTVTHTDLANKAVWAEAYQLVHPSGSLGGTAAGLWLVGLAWDDPVRGRLFFQPTGNGVHLLPSPVQRAQNDVQYVGAATDPATLTTLQITRNVRDRARIDACGQLVDSFRVEVAGILTTTRGVQRVAWTQHWATAYGVADVEHTFALSDPVDEIYTRTLRNTTVPAAVAAP